MIVVHIHSQLGFLCYPNGVFYVRAKLNSICDRVSDCFKPLTMGKLEEEKVSGCGG